MTAADVAALNSGESTANFGTWLVIIGVAGEGLEIAIKIFEHKHDGNSFLTWWKRHVFWVDISGGIFWMLVIIGLVIEHRGNNETQLIVKRENTRITELAGQAIKEAGLANIRAANTESNNLILRSNVVALEEKAAEFAKIITNTQNELEANEEPMNILGPLPPGVTFFSGESSSLFHESLIKIPKMRVMILNVLDIRAKFTANRLAYGFHFADWDVTNRDAATSWLGIYIGVAGWVDSFRDDIKNWPKTLPPNAQVKTGLRLLQLLTSYGLPAKIGEQVQGKWAPGDSWPSPPNIDIAIPTNTILIVVGQRPFPLMTKYMLLQAKKQLLGAERREIRNRAELVEPIKGKGYQLKFSDADEARLQYLMEESRKMDLEEAELYKEEKPRYWHNMGRTN